MAVFLHFSKLPNRYIYIFVQTYVHILVRHLRGSHALRGGGGGVLPFVNIKLALARSASGVSICTFVLVKQVK